MSGRFCFCLLVSMALLASTLMPYLLEVHAEEKPAATATMPERKQVTLRAAALTVGQAVQELARQTGITIEVEQGIADSNVRLDLSQATFWQAVDAIADASKGQVYLYPTSGRIVLVRRHSGYRVPPRCYDGRFRLSVKRVTATRDLERKDTDPSFGTCSVTIEVAWDPALQPLFLETRPHGVRLVDDTKTHLVIPDEGSSLAPVDGRIALSLDLRLPALPRSVAKISTLEGDLSMIGPSKMLMFPFDTLDKLSKASVNDPERRLTQEGVTCHIRRVLLDRQRWTIQVALDYPPGMKQLDSNQSWVVNNEMVLESIDGKKRLVSSQYVVETATPRQAILSYHFRDRGELRRGKASDWKLRYRTPADLIDMPIKFAFKDIVLP
jgi:hypothetical protein